MCILTHHMCIQTARFSRKRGTWLRPLLLQPLESGRILGSTPQALVQGVQVQPQYQSSASMDPETLELIECHLAVSCSFWEHQTRGRLVSTQPFRERKQKTCHSAFRHHAAKFVDKAGVSVQCLCVCVSVDAAKRHGP